VPLSRHQSSAAGFTLLEVIVVLVITALLSVVLIQGLGLVLAVRNTFAGKILDLDRTLIRRTLVMEPLRGIIPDYFNHAFVFSGASRQLRGLTIGTLQERAGTPTGFTMSLTYSTDRRETLVIYQEEGRDPVELMSWPDDVGAFSYRDISGDWLDAWPPDDKATQTPWLIRLTTGKDETSTIIISVAGAHKRTPRMQDAPGTMPNSE
jgi:prepilin-type N-terminal cleavage/methylation domain-containing protein